MKKFFALALVAVVMVACKSSGSNPKSVYKKAPENFTVRFETTKGDFDIEATRFYSPMAVDRFYHLVRTKYFDGQYFYRTVPNFVAQFGTLDKKTRDYWDALKVQDEPVLKSNQPGWVSFARGGVGTRTTDLFINLRDNTRLDTLDYNGVKGFPAFGKVIKGMEVVTSLNGNYGDAAMEDFELMLNNKEAFLKKYPDLDMIKKAYFID